MQVEFGDREASTRRTTGTQARPGIGPIMLNRL
jgi:hypothetical protein